MIRMKRLGLALVAALVLTALLVSPASAQFTSNREHTKLFGSQKTGTNDVFTAGSGFAGITCENALFAGTAASQSESAQVIFPEYENCHDSFGRTVDTFNSSLTYTFTSGANKGTVHVSGGMTLTVTASLKSHCTVVIKSPQTDTGISYTNLGGTSGVEVTTHVRNVVSTTSGGFFVCGISDGDHKEGTYDGTEIITGEDTNGAAAEIRVD
jgi:hypothetical protein